MTGLPDPCSLLPRRFDTLAVKASRPENLQTIYRSLLLGRQIDPEDQEMHGATQAYGPGEAPSIAAVSRPNSLRNSGDWSQAAPNAYQAGGMLSFPACLPQRGVQLITQAGPECTTVLELLRYQSTESESLEQVDDERTDPRER